MAQSKVATIREFIAGSHYMSEDSLRDYHTARKIRDTVHIKGIERRLQRSSTSSTHTGLPLQSA